MPFVTGQVDRGTLYGTLYGVRVSFLGPIPDARFDSPGRISVAVWQDSATGCMKLSAIAQRGSKKDFVDLYALGSLVSIGDMLDGIARSSR